jgi:hypothetical protein
MANRTGTRRGPRPGMFRTADGQELAGLSKLPDGRWRIGGGTVGGREVRFTAATETDAVTRYHEILRDKLPQPAPPPPRVPIDPDDVEQRRDINGAALSVALGHSPIPGGEPIIWAWIVRTILTDPDTAAGSMMIPRELLEPIRVYISSRK